MGLRRVRRAFPCSKPGRSEKGTTNDTLAQSSQTTTSSSSSVVVVPGRLYCKTVQLASECGSKVLLTLTCKKQAVRNESCLAESTVKLPNWLQSVAQTWSSRAPVKDNHVNNTSSSFEIRLPCSMVYVRHVLPSWYVEACHLLHAAGIQYNA